MARSNKAKRRRKHRKQQERPEVALNTPDRAVRPPKDRARHNTVRIPRGMGKNELPALVVDCDPIAAMYEAKQITYSQEQAARVYEQAYADNLAELGVSTGRSCLDIGPVGHDEGDGNPEAIARYRRITRAVGMFELRELERVVVDRKTCRRLPLLQSALTKISEMRS